MYLKGNYIARRSDDRANSHRKFFRNERTVFQWDPEIIQPTQGKPSSFPHKSVPMREARGKEAETAVARWAKSWSISTCVDSLQSRGCRHQRESTSFLCPPSSRRKSKCLCLALKFSLDIGPMRQRWSDRDKRIRRGWQRENMNEENGLS